jgi:hypothetical protein
MSVISLSQGTENTGEVHLVDIVFRSGAMPPHVRGLLCLCMLRSRSLMHTSCRHFSLCASVLAIFLFFVLIRTNSPGLCLHADCSLAQVATTIFVRLATEDKAAMAAAAVVAVVVAVVLAALDPPAIEARPRPHPRHPRRRRRHRPRFPPRSSPVRINHCSAEWCRASPPHPRPRGVLPMVPPYRFHSMRRIRPRPRRRRRHHTRRVVVVVPLGCNAIAASSLATIRMRARTLRAQRAPPPRRRHFNISMVPAAATIIVAVGARDRGPALTVDKKVRLHFLHLPANNQEFLFSFHIASSASDLDVICILDCDIQLVLLLFLRAGHFSTACPNPKAGRGGFSAPSFRGGRGGGAGGGANRGGGSGSGGRGGGRGGRGGGSAGGGWNAGDAGKRGGRSKK